MRCVCILVKKLNTESNTMAQIFAIIEALRTKVDVLVRKVDESESRSRDLQEQVSMLLAQKTTIQVPVVDDAVLQKLTRLSQDLRQDVIESRRLTESVLTLKLEARVKRLVNEQVAAATEHILATVTANVVAHSLNASNTVSAPTAINPINFTNMVTVPSSVLIDMPTQVVAQVTDTHTLNVLDDDIFEINTMSKKTSKKKDKEKH